MKVVLTPVRGPDGRVYFNLDEVADLIERSDNSKWGRIPRRERRFWVDLLRQIGDGATERALEAERGRSS